MYQSSEAYRLDAREQVAPLQHKAPSLEVIKGKGLDAQVRRGVSPQFLTRLKVIATVVALLSVIGFVRVGFYTATVSVLSDNANIRSEIKQARSIQDDLRIERSVLSSNSRITRIATQSYGMVAAASSEHMSADDANSQDTALNPQDATSDPQDAASEPQDAASESQAAESEPQDAASEPQDVASADDSLARTSLSGDVGTGDGSTAGANAASLA